jgi:hypothetical protein
VEIGETSGCRFGAFAVLGDSVVSIGFDQSGDDRRSQRLSIVTVTGRDPDVKHEFNGSL